MAIHTPTSEARRVHMATDEASRVYSISRLHQSVDWLPYEDVDFSRRSILNTQVYNCEYSKWNFISIKLRKLNFRQLFVNINNARGHVMLFVEGCGLSHFMYVKFSQRLQTHSFGVNP